MSKYTVKDLQKSILIVLNEVDRVCTENNIRFFLCGGSCLGAVRHNGFIPWDDDADVLMDRDNYDKFYSLCLNGTLSNRFSLQSFQTENNYFEPWIRIRLKDTKCVIPYHKSNGYKQLGVFVDVFPCNYSYTNDERVIKKYVKKCFFYEKILNLKSASQLKTVKSKLASLLFAFINKNKAFDLRTKAEKSLDKSGERKYIIDPYCKYGFKKALFPIEISNELSTHAFENLILPIPKNYDLYLKKTYGDYMKLPPKEEQIGHLPEEIEL